MKIFRTIRKNFAANGFGPDPSLINKHHVGAILIYLTVNVLAIAYVYHEVHTVEDGMLSCFLMITINGVFICFLNTMCKKAELNEFIDHYQSVIDECK